jgi:hypothetical protein
MRERHNATSREVPTMEKRKRQESTNAKAKDSKRWKNLSGIVEMQTSMRKAERREYGEMCSEAVETGLGGRRKFDGPKAVHILDEEKCEDSGVVELSPSDFDDSR